MVKTHARGFADLPSKIALYMAMFTCWSFPGMYVMWPRNHRREFKYKFWSNGNAIWNKLFFLASNDTNLLSYSSEVRNMKWVPLWLKSRCWQGCVPSGGTGGKSTTCLCSFTAWLLASGWQSHHSDLCFCCHGPFLTQIFSSSLSFFKEPMWLNSPG